MNKDLLYYIPTGEFGKEGVLSLLKTAPGNPVRVSRRH